MEVEAVSDSEMNDQFAELLRLRKNSNRKDSLPSKRRLNLGESSTGNGHWRSSSEDEQTPPIDVPLRKARESTIAHGKSPKFEFMFDKLQGVKMHSD